MVKLKHISKWPNRNYRVQTIQNAELMVVDISESTKFCFYLTIFVIINRLIYSEEKSHVTLIFTF